MKIKAKRTLLYSILKPLISSLSPSTKSKGARLVSAIQHTTHWKRFLILRKVTEPLKKET
jgi:hypothetical protein